ncbi:hypothetical protein GCM10023094_05750 [Rhodococcus olei]|uniref:Uncharacterized protein n=1 Tax=Rhodococcus olei TaxID=2161675 RepID=A0ABP8NT62_9NOCA
MTPAAAVDPTDQGHFRTTTESFNRRWTFATRDGQVASLDAQPVPVREFVRSMLGGRRFTDTAVTVTDTGFHIALWNLTPSRA